MPRFLDAWTGEFEWHSNPKHVVYAILSHTWRSPEEGGEQTYDDVRALQAAAAKEPRKPEVAVDIKNIETDSNASGSSSLLSHSQLSDKIKGFCKVARNAGYRLVWNDTCCMIDKSSSAELSEAINSMYELYRLADVCYVYLEDVPDGVDPRKPYLGFWTSRWHRRGWTLQELIAPKNVEFLTNTWRLLGTKIGLATTLERITGVDFKILIGQAAVDSVSVARRMSWAARQETTRVEDKAYCLLGIFGVHMSPIYGEGDNAFSRLQEEIVRTIPDQSILAWNHCKAAAHPSHPGLFALSPANFAECGDIHSITSSVFVSHLHFKGSEEVPPLHCVFTPQGVRVQLLSLEMAITPLLIKALWSQQLHRYPCPNCVRPQVDTFALLQCKDKNGSLIALPLHRPREEADGESGMLV